MGFVVVTVSCSVTSMALSSGQVMTFRETLTWPSRIRGDQDAAEKTLNGEKVKLVEELEWRIERHTKTMAELSTLAMKVGRIPVVVQSTISEHE